MLGFVMVAVTIVPAVTVSAVYEAVLWENGQTDVVREDESDDIDEDTISVPPSPETHSGDGWDRVAPEHNRSEFRVITFGPNFTLPDCITVPVPILEVTNPLCNTTDGEALLREYDLYWINESTTVQAGPDGFSLRNAYNSTYVDYRSGTIVFRGEDPEYEPPTESEIATNDSLLNKSEALQVAVGYLKTHALYNASWELAAQGAHARQNVMETELQIVEYLYVFTPVILGRSLVHSDGPKIMVYIDPLGRIINLRVVLRDIRMTGESALPRFQDPVDALEEIEHNYYSYFMCEQPSLNVVRIDPGYMPCKENPTRVVPCWAIYYGSGDSAIGL
jgi:hypothetical protein